jgi:geranylgeranyl diphosphate synthase type II
MPTATLADYLRDARARVDAALDGFLPAPPACPPRLAEAMRYSLFAGGKRLRPVLALASAEAVAAATGTPADTAVALALPAACALEMIHTYSLVHDDLPAMDDDALRRGRPTAHVVYGEALAILAGDALLTEAFALLAREPASHPALAPDELAARKLAVIARVATAAGATGMAGGQTLDLAAEQAGPPEAGERAALLRTIHAQKTGALIRASAVAGGLMAGAPPALVDALDRFATEVGLAFQIVDDILDVEGAAADLGKATGKDAARGKLTYPALYGVARSRQLAAACVERACAALAAAGLGGRLPALAHWIVERAT